MKRFFTVGMALLIAGSAFAQEVKPEVKKGPEFSFGIKGTAFGSTGAQSDFAYDYSHIRVRPSLTASNGNVKGVVTFEIDQDFGKNGADAGADPGTDNKVVEVKHAYIEVKDAADVKGLSLMAGLNGYSFPMVVNNDFAVYQAGYDFGMGKAIFSYIKIEENSNIENTAADVDQVNDADVYALDLPINLGTIKVRPGVLAFKGSEFNTTFAEANLMNYALNVSADLGMVAVNVTGAYLSGDLNATTETTAYGFDANVEIKPVDNVKVGAFFTYGTGNDGTAADEDNSYFYNMNRLLGANVSAADALAGKTASGAPDGRLFLLENAGVAANGGYNYFDVMDNAAGWMSYGIYAEAKFDKLTAFAQFGMASTVEEANAAGDKSIGTEIDLKVSYEVAPKTTVFVEYANFMAGDVSIGQYTATDAESAYNMAWGLTTSI